MDYATMQQLLLQGKAATTFNGTWLLPPAAGRLARPSRSTCTSRRRRSSTARRTAHRSWPGPASRCRPRRAANRDSVYAFLEYASQPGGRPGRRRGPAVLLADRRRRTWRSTTRSRGSSCRCSRTPSRPWTGCGSPRSTPRSTARSRRSCKGDTDAAVRRQGDRGRRRGAAFVGSQLLPVTEPLVTGPLLETKLYVPRLRRAPVARRRLQRPARRRSSVQADPRSPLLPASARRRWSGRVGGPRGGH